LSHTGGAPTGVGAGFGQPGWGAAGKSGVSAVQWHPDNVRRQGRFRKTSRELTTSSAANKTRNGLGRRPQPRHPPLGSAQLEGAREGELKRRRVFCSSELTFEPFPRSSPATRRESFRFLGAARIRTSSFLPARTAAPSHGTRCRVTLLPR
jgi:hypothetical protein